METLQTTIQVITWVIALIIAILFLVSLQNTIKAAAPENRMMKPGFVWIQLIPFVGAVYSFIVAGKVADTIAAEYKSKGQMLPAARPTYGLGMTFAIFSLILYVLNIYSRMKFGSVDPSTMTQEEMIAYSTRPDVMGFSMIVMIFTVVWLIIFIIYWVKTSGYKNKMKTLPDNNSNSSIFNNF